jgi:hypothetical protein
MRSAYLFAAALLLALAAAAPAADLAASTPLYWGPTSPWGYLQKPRVKAALRITKEQDKRIQAALNKSINLREDFDATAKITGPGKEARTRAYLTRRTEEVFRSLRGVLTARQEKRLRQIMLQQWGMGLFDHPEIRKALRIGDREVRALRAAWDKLEQDAAAEIRAKRMSPQESHRKFAHMAFGVPERVRAVLTEAQRKTLEGMLGEPHDFNP